MANFCDNLLKKVRRITRNAEGRSNVGPYAFIELLNLDVQGGTEKLSDDEIESTLDKVGM